ncbi:flavin-containing monooxygenase [Sutcliffiella rhizosphaerae]|uniref:Oxidoreductase CzcO n=1 Tax=Sutcliffiella rhizosphaerae TaxID=2880967 RepID=A0ABM8YUS5_9BACI|nr:NAD(P)/FAD-dependent oxidoreductase [Sutcliffiella rhizosphaerae]CAG9623731.1 putative oxidoreductase CzcO [Sutcliffiella rhizosphaerae]
MHIYETVIIGGGQAGITMGYYLKKAGKSFVILDENKEVGASWRNRYKSLVLFTPRQYSSLPELPMDGPKGEFPSKDDVANYLESYVKHFNLPILPNTKVIRLTKNKKDTFIIETNTGLIEAHHVIVATGAFQKPYIPSIVKEQTDIHQSHSSHYQSPEEILGESVLVVGGGNSGAQIAVELAKQKNVTIAVNHPFKFLPLHLFGKSIFSWLDRTGLLYAGKDTVKGKWFQKQKDPIFGKELKRLIKMNKVERKPKAISLSGHEVTFEDKTTQHYDSVIWATGFIPSYDWIAIEGLTDGKGMPIHNRGITPIKGLYFIGLPWQHQRGSALICGVSLDAEFIAMHLSDHS